MDQPGFGTVAVIGLGLIGGSLLRRAAVSGRVVGCDTDSHARAAAREAGYEVAESVAAAVAGADLAVLAVPLPAVPGVLADVAAAASEGLLLTDVVSVKSPLRRLAADLSVAYVGGHPMAGTERSGFAASRADLFDGARWVLCLDDETSLDAWLRLARWVTGLGSVVVPATAAEHDIAVARASHLPHLLAVVAADAVAGDRLARSLAAGSFRDTSRVAATAPALTAAMCSGNADAVRAELDIAIDRLAEARRLLAAGGDLVPWLRHAALVRRQWPTALAAPEIRPIDPDLRAALLDLGRAGGVVESVDSRHVTVRHAVRDAS